MKNGLYIEFENKKLLKIWLDMDIADNQTYCVIKTNISNKEKRINIEKEMGEFFKEVDMEGYADG